MEHDEKALPIDVRVLGALASRVGAYAKALHYKEMEYHNTENPGALRAHHDVIIFLWPHAAALHVCVAHALYF